jgi:3-dehydroquinate synthase II
MELWLDAASDSSGVIEPHPADRILLASGDVVPTWAENPLFACEDGRVLDEENKSVGAHVDISDAAGQDAARSMVGLVQWLVLSTGEWQMIPLENLVAAAQDSGTSIVARIDAEQAIRGAAFALETGVDALLIPPGDAELWAQAQTIAAERLSLCSQADESQEAELVEVEIIAIEDGGVGDRACIDLTSMLKVGEGLLIGSSAAAMVLVHGETLDSEFVPPRPFRVNAGAVHAYVLMADDSTKYLCELKAGDAVAVCDAQGDTRSVVVGRLKIESRPFLLVRFHHLASGTIGQTFLQQAETVRLVSPAGEMPSVTTLCIGDYLLARIGASARHIGQNVMSASEER